MSDPLNILVLCTGNSARSILAEALFNHLGGGRVRAFSAGSQPAGRVNPFALQVLGEDGIVPADPRSKSWDEFAAPDAPRMHVVITVCDNAANEVCPVWPGAPVSVHWGLPDPAAAMGNDEEKRQAFRDTMAAIRVPVEAFLSLSFEGMTPDNMKARLQDMAPTGE